MSSITHCRICGTPCERLICGAPACVEGLAQVRRIAAIGTRIDADLGKIRTGWPAEWATTKPFADNVRAVPCGRVGLPVSFAGGCSSSAGWLVNLPDG